MANSASACTSGCHEYLLRALTCVPVWLSVMWQGKLVDMFTGIPTKEQLSTFLHKMLDLAPAATPAQEEVGWALVKRNVCSVHEGKVVA